MGTVRNHYDTPTVCVDLDGVLAVDYEGGDSVGRVFRDMAQMVNAWKLRGHRVVIASSRPQAHGPQVAHWLDMNDIAYDQLVLGAKPPADVYVDDKGLLLPSDALDALVEWRCDQRDGEDPLGTISTRVHNSRWTSAMEAVPENPALDDPPSIDLNYRVVVPVTGGMDSTTAWAMAMEAGVNAVPVYVDTGQEYAKAEREVVDQLVRERHVWDLEAMPIAERWQHVMPRRNAVILLTIAEWMQEEGWWGEVWFGNLAGETPAWGGDKSARFVNTTQQLMVALGYDVQIVQPLRGLDKTDLVRWWQARGLIDVLATTKSCLDPVMRACGRCQTCFRKYVAFRASGFTHALDWDQEPDWSVHVAKYEPLMREAVKRNDWSRYSPARCRDTLEVIDYLNEENG